MNLKVRVVTPRRSPKFLGYLKIKYTLRQTFNFFKFNLLTIVEEESDFLSNVMLLKDAKDFSVPLITRTLSIFSQL